MIETFGLLETRSTWVKVGDRFGRLTVVALGRQQNKAGVYAVCDCECGTQKKVRNDTLKSGAVLSCGCLQREASTTHGMTKSGHYGRWRHMMDRCYKPSNDKYSYYGGRGIMVCDAWHDVATYVAELPIGYYPGAELDRIDNDKGYEPGNVRWSTSKQNNDNRRNSVRLTFNGKTQSQKDWARQIGIKDSLIHERIHSLGWSVEKTLSTPKLTQDQVVHAASKVRWAGHDTKGKPAPKTTRRFRVVEHNGRTYTMAQLSELCGISAKNLHRRIVELGWDVGRAIQT